MIYHVFLGRVSGGVDVFFVVAGFLITTLLLADVDRHGHVRTSRYLSRLATRLLPLSLTVLTVVAVSVLLLSPPWRRQGWWQEIVASAVYLENWALVDKSVVYIGQGEPMSPVQHYWALSIQGQFYVIWLVVFVVAAALARRWALRPVVLTMLVGLFAGSLAFSIWLTRENQAVAYFHTGTRVWEFAAGGLIALLMLAVPSRGRVLGLLAGWLGVAMIVSGGLLFPVAASFPGYLALWPVVGCALVLWAGHSPAARAPGSATWMLGSVPLVFLGSISYGIYLWHWPLLTFYRSGSVDGEVPLAAGLVIIAISIGLAVVTTWFLEKPVRAWLSTHQPPWRVIGIGVATAAATASAALVLAQTAPASAPTGVSATGVNSASVGSAPATSSATGQATTSAVVAAFHQRPEIYSGCHQDPFVAEPQACTFGESPSPTTVMLVGGSHAAQFFEPLKSLADANGWRLISVTKSDCRFTAEPQPDTAQGRSCQEWNDLLMERIRQDPPDVLVTTSTVTATGDGAEFVPDGYLDHWRALEAAGVLVLGIRDTPRWPVTPLDCLWTRSDAPQQCRIERSWSLADEDPTLSAPLPANVTPVDLTDELCGPQACPALVGTLIGYYDSEHITPPVALTLAPALGRALTRVLDGTGAE